MKRWLIAMTTFVLVTAACTAGGGSSDAPSAVDTGSGASHAPVTLQMWGAWTGRELQQFNKIFDGFTEKYPWITVNSVGGVNDQKIIAAINAGNPPDAVLSFTLDSVGQFCASGAWQDLNPYIEQSGFDVSQFPPSVEAYTSFAGSRCAFPFLTDALRALLQHATCSKKAGIDGPPKTLTELEADAKKLTVFNSDGSIKVAGFVPWFGYYEFSTPEPGEPLRREVVQRRRHDVGGRHRPGVEGHVPTGSTTSSPTCTVAATSRRGRTSCSGSSPARGTSSRRANDFETGRVAMNYRRRVAARRFIADEAPDLPYATAPYPVPDDQADTYGRGPVGGTIIGIPKGSPHPDEAWLLVDYMATDTDDPGVHGQQRPERADDARVAQLAGPGCHAAVPDVPGHLRRTRTRHYKEPSAIGAADQDILAAFADKWQAGKETDLDAGLDERRAQQINDQLAQAAI